MAPYLLKSLFPHLPYWLRNELLFRDEMFVPLAGICLGHMNAYYCLSNGIYFSGAISVVHPYVIMKR